MNKDEAGRLLGGYATGSLTEAERTALFQAALQDQELFDELSGEQVLKEVLDEPGARQRLISALEPQSSHRAWLWGWAGAIATLAIVAGVIMVNRAKQPEPPAQIAQVLKSPEPVAPVEPVAPPIAAPAPPAPPPPQMKQNASVALAKRVAPEEPPSKPQAPSPAAAATADAVQEFAAQRGPATGALRAKTEAATVTLGFGFGYTVLVGGALQITPAEPGFLTVIAGDTVVFPSMPVPEFTPVTIPLPAAASSVMIGFSRAPALTGTPVRRDALTGRETDQDPPNGRIFIQLFLKPATQ